MMKHFDYTKYRRFPPIMLGNRQWPDKVIEKAPIWASVDLRDGNQALIEPMTIEQRLRFFKLLVKVGFKQIEVGFPAASAADYDFTRLLIEQDLVPDDVTIQVITQAREALIERTFEALVGAKKAIMFIYNTTSKLQLEKVYGLAEDDMIGLATTAARLVLTKSATYPQTKWQFNYGLESFSGTDLDFSIRVSDAVSEVWQPTPDNKMILGLGATVEVSTPNILADQVEYLCSRIQRRDSILVSIHTHNDRGTGVAAGELACMAGADRVEGTLLGNGERTGNMDILVMAMNLYTQGIDPLLDLSQMDEIIAVVDQCTKIPLHPRHPYVGDLVFSSFAGGHQHAIDKCLSQRKPGDPWEVAYLPIDPKDLGRSYQQLIRINAQSGKGGIKHVIESHFGVNMPRWAQLEFSQVVQSHAEAVGGELLPQTIWTIFEQHYLMHDPQTSHQIEQNMARLKAAGGEAQIDFLTDQFHCQLTGLYQIDIDIISLDAHQMFGEQDNDYVCFVQLSCQGQRVGSVALLSGHEQASLCAIVSGVHEYMARGAAI
ncbi:MAG: 2-isopropylmalate synthase [Phenylobacterium sp.]|jgi:2-isopropylmalate synthase